MMTRISHFFWRTRRSEFVLESVGDEVFVFVELEGVGETYSLEGGI